MKKLVKVLLGIEICLWVLAGVSLVLYIFRQADWAIEFANWLCSLFKNYGEGPYFLLWLGDNLLWFVIGLSVVTLGTVFTLIILSGDEKVDENEAQVDAKRAKRAARKQSKSEEKVSKEAELEKKVVAPAPQPKASVNPEISNFLNNLRRK